MDNVRPGEVGEFTLNKVTWVEGESGGISVYDVGKQRAGNRWWELKKYTVIPNDLSLNDDRAGASNHWMFEPATTMPLARYVAALGTLGNLNNWTRLPGQVIPLVSAQWGQVRFSGYTPRRSAQGMAAVTDEETPPQAPPLDWSPKVHRYVLEAVAQQILGLRRALSRDGLDDDEHSDIANDLTLYEGIRQALELRAPRRAAS